MEISGVKVSYLEQLHLMEGDDFTIDVDMDETSENLVCISDSNDEISNQDTERPRETDKDMTSYSQILSRDKQNPNEMPTNGTCGNLVMSGNVRKSLGTMCRDSTLPRKKLRMKEALSEMASAVKALMNKRGKNNSSFEDALSVLQAMPDIDEDLVMDASDLLEDETKAKIFLALDISLRKKWLLRKLRHCI